jgi:hypothetical protein
MKIVLVFIAFFMVSCASKNEDSFDTKPVTNNPDVIPGYKEVAFPF